MSLVPFHFNRQGLGRQERRGAGKKYIGFLIGPAVIGGKVVDVLTQHNNAGAVALVNGNVEGGTGR